MTISPIQLECLTEAASRDGVSYWDSGYGSATIAALKRRGLIEVGADTRLYATMAGRYYLEKAATEGAISP